MEYYCELIAAIECGGLNIPGKILSKTKTMKPERKISSLKEGPGA
jgi:hypothetical protein